MPEQAKGFQALQAKVSAAQASNQGASSGQGAEMLGVGDAARASQNSVVSMNTGAAIAGLQPWSKDWVFTQGDLKNPELKGLISRGDAAQTTGPGSMQVSPEVKAAIAQKLGLSEAEMPELDRMLSQLNGSLEVAASQIGEGAMPAAKAQGQSKMLGGNDFLGAMGLAQPMRVGSAEQQKSAAFGNSSQQQPGTGLGKPELKVLDGGKLKKSGGFELSDAGLPAFSGAEVIRQSSNPALAHPGQLRLPEVTGHVVSGRMAQDRLSSESLMGITQSIAGIGGGMQGGQGSGEIRVRLKPENLGELHLRVMTDGSSVALKIQASDSKAKQILEESLSHLKDSLHAASLSLGKVEVSVAQAPSQNFADSRQDSSSQGQSQAFGDFARNNQQSGSNSQSRWDNEGTASNARPAARSWVAPTPSSANRASASSNSSGGSRIDLHA